MSESQAAPASSWFALGVPRGELRNFVVSLVAYVELDGVAALRRQWPTNLYPLILVLGPGFTLAERADGARVARALDRSFLAGLQEAPVSIGSGGTSVCMQVDLSPLGAHRLFGMGLDELRNAVFDVTDLLGRPRYVALIDRLRRLDTWSARFEPLEQWLADAILDAPARRTSPVVAEALARIVTSGGRLRVDALAAELRVSRQQLHRQFLRQVGCGPKYFQRVTRFRSALALLDATPGAGSGADLALRLGYADQAHFIRDFRRFSGITPTSFRREGERLDQL